MTLTELSERMKQVERQAQEELHKIVQNNSGRIVDICRKLGTEMDTLNDKLWGATHKPVVDHVQKCPRVARKPDKAVETMQFGSREHFDRFLLVGKYPRHSSPCVDYERNNQATLKPEHALVYEEWQRHSERRFSKIYHCHRAGTATSVIFYRCRRHRTPATKQRKSAKECVGCACKATLTAVINVDGTVAVTFRGKHNHTTQGGTTLEYINPIVVSRHIREMVDEKLYAGVKNAGKIRLAIQDELLQRRKQHKSFLQLRLFNMSIALKTKHIGNRRRQLCLDKSDTLAHTNDAEAVAELVNTWQEDLGV